MSTRGNILIVSDAAALAAEFNRIVVKTADAAIARRGAFAICLSGGSTPRSLYENISKNSLPWEKFFFFFGDERAVPPDDPQSNFGMADESLFKPLEINPSRIFRWRTELGDPHAAAADYQTRLTEFFDGPPRFDLCLLGLGADGHTASLFPETEALTETERVAVANWVPTFDRFRLTLTASALNESENVLFVAVGREKAKAVAAVIEGARDPRRLPAQLIAPADGTVQWLIDTDAAAMLRAD